MTLNAQTWEDVTGTYIVNPDFEGGSSVAVQVNTDRAVYSPDGWTASRTGGDTNDMTFIETNMNQDSQDWLSYSGKSYFVRSRWAPSGTTISVQQTISELVAGSYMLKFQGRAFDGGTGGSAVVTVTTGGTTAQQAVAKSATDNPEWAEYSIAFAHVSGDVTITFSSTKGSANFKTGFDEFQLFQEVVGLADLVDAYNAAVVEAQALYEGTAVMAADVKQALQTATTAAVDMDDADAVFAARAVIVEATAQANASIAQYSDLAAAIADATTLAASAGASGVATYEAAIAAAQAAYDAATTNAAAVAAIATLAEATLAFEVLNASAANPTDLSSLIVNPSFETNVNGWVNTGSMVRQGNDSFGEFKDGGSYLERWAGSSLAVPVGISQTISGLPNGVYKVVAPALASGGDNGVAELFANAEITNVTGNPATMFDVTANVTDGTLTFGFRKTTGTANYIAVDNFKLYYYGIELTELQGAYAASVIDATDICDNEVLAADVKAALSALATATVDTDDKEALTNANAAILAAIADANASIAIYANLDAELADANALVNTAAEGNAAYTAAIATAQGVYTAAATNAAATTAIANLKKAALAYQVVNATGAEPLDLTAYIVNANFDDAVTVGWTSSNGGVGNGWGIKDNGEFAGQRWAEVWRASNTGRANRYIKQTVKDLPAGNYKLSVDVFAADQVTTANENTGSVTLQAGGNSTAIAIYDYENEAVQSEAGLYAGRINAEMIFTLTGDSLVIGLFDNASNANWIGLDNFKLFYVGDPNKVPEAPAAVKPVTTGQYYIQQVASSNYLTNPTDNTAAGARAAINAIDNTNLDAFKWNVTVSTDVTGVRDTVSIQQVSSGNFFSSGDNGWNTNLYAAGNTNLRNWVLNDVSGDDTYRLTSLKNTERFIKTDALSGVNVALFFDFNGSGNATQNASQYFQFFNAAEYDAYLPTMILYDTKVAIQNAVNEAKNYQTGILGGTHTPESEAALQAAIDAALAAYSNEAATQAELDVELTSIKDAIKVYQYATVGSEENPADFTFAVPNPNFNSGQAAPWTSTTNAQNKTAGATNKSGMEGSATTGNFYENWNPNPQTAGQIHQTVTGLPNGKYEMTIAAFVQAHATPGVGPDGSAYVFLNDAQETVPSEAADALPKYYSVTGIVTDGTMSIGLAITDEANAQWIGIDNVSLKFFGNSTDVKKAALQALIDDATNVLTGTMQDVVAATLTNSVGICTDMLADDETTDEAFDAAIQQLGLDIAAANVSIMAYTSLEEWNAAVVVRMDEFGIATPGAELAAAIAQGTTMYAETTVDAEAIADFLVGANLAFNTEAVAANNHNATFLLVNPRFDDGKTGWTAPDWGTYNGGNTTYTGWAADYATAPANNVVLDAGADNSNAFQTVNAPAGYYILTAVGRGQTSGESDIVIFMNNGTDAANTGGTDEATALIERLGDGADVGLGNGWQQVETGAITLTTAGTLTVGVRLGATGGWESVDNFKLQWYANEAEYQEVVVGAFNRAKAALEAAIVTADSLLAADAAVQPEFLLAGKPKVDLVAANDASKALVATATTADIDALIASAAALKTTISGGLTSADRAKTIFGYYQDALAAVATVAASDHEQQFAELSDALIATFDAEIALYTVDLASADPRRTIGQLLTSRNKLKTALDAYLVATETIGMSFTDEDGVKVYFDGSTIVVEGADNYTIYNISGTPVSNDIALPAGTYIVKVGARSIKVAIP